MSLELFKNLKLSDQKLKETFANPKLTTKLTHILNVAVKNHPIDTHAFGPLLYTLASVSKDASDIHLQFITSAIVDSRISSNDQISAALDYFKHSNLTNVDEFLKNTDQFNAACGVGVVVTPEDITVRVKNVIDNAHDELVVKRYSMLGPLLLACRNNLRWANGLLVKVELEKQMLELLGPKDERDNPKKVWQ
jgi:glutaminyl-tRNA synthetase